MLCLLGQLTFPTDWQNAQFAPTANMMRLVWMQQINSTKPGTHLEPACESKMSDSRPCAPPFALGDATPRPGGTFWVRSPRFPVMIEKNLCEGMFMRAMLTMSALCLAVGTADAQDNRAAPIFSSQIGRFQIVTNARDTFLFDSATGNVWLLTQYSDFNKDPLAWVPMFRLDKPSDTTPLLSEYGLKQKR